MVNLTKLIVPSYFEVRRLRDGILAGPVIIESDPERALRLFAKLVRSYVLTQCDVTDAAHRVAKATIERSLNFVLAPQMMEFFVSSLDGWSMGQRERDLCEWSRPGITGHGRYEVRMVAVGVCIPRPAELS